MTGFPIFRGRRLRRIEPLRAIVRETTLTPERLVLPLFAIPGRGVREEIASMPGVERLSVDEIVRDAAEAMELGLGGVILFGVPTSKDPEATEAWSDDGVVQQAVRALRAECPDLLVITDVCLCAYTDHGHCGLLDAGGRILNDASVERLTRVAVSHARAGADVVAPSDMMDGRVAAIRSALDENDFPETPILSHAAKYASAFYGPFRDAADSAPRHGDRRGYQMDPANAVEALREARADLAEGADIVMVKPALPSLDVIRRIRDDIDAPVAAYQVSGEYAALVAAAERGWIDGPRAFTEALVAIHRAGAGIILTYWAREFARRFRLRGR